MFISRRALGLVALILVGAFLFLNWALGTGFPGKVNAARSTANEGRLAETLPCTAADEPVNFLTFGVGGSLDGLALTEVLRRCDHPYPGEPVAANYVSYIYGGCDPTDPAQDGRDSCQPPLEIQTWPACQRSLADYSGAVLKGFEPLPDRRGATRVMSGDGRVEIYTGDVTGVVFLPDPEVLMKAADGIGFQPYLESRDWIRPHANEERPEELRAETSLVSPARGGSLKGEIRCS